MATSGNVQPSNINIKPNPQNTPVSVQSEDI